MNKRSLGLLLAPLLALFAATAYADAIVVGNAVADHAGNFVLDMQVDPNADPVYVADQLKSNLQLSSGQVKSVEIEDGVAHVSVEGATPGANVQATVDNDIALGTGVSTAPVENESRRRGWWWLTSLAGLGGLAALPGGGGGGAAPLAEEPTPVPTVPLVPPPPPPVPTPTPPPVLSPGP